MEIAMSNYRIVRQLYESSNSLVYRAIRDADQQPVILKMLCEAYPSPERIAWFKREYEVTRHIGLDIVPLMYALKQQDNRWIMEMEDFGGDALNLLKAAGKLSVRDFLALAITITEILGQIHQLRMIHKDLCPANIVWNRTTGKVKIIDFGISTVLAYENQTFRNPNVLEGTLAYIAPEQTGRMNRAVDYRADFYALGVTFYELLTGQLPFQTDDPLELVHCHIAKQPVPPIERIDDSQLTIDNSQLSILSAIIMKLLAKNAEDRYQSAFGLQADLEKCLECQSSALAAQAELAHSMAPFALGQQDVSDRFTIPQPIDAEKLFDILARLLPIVWRYADAPVAAEFDATDDEIVPPPRDDLEALCELAMLGKVFEAQSYVERLETQDARYRPFARKICDWARAFEDKEISAFVRRYLEEQA